MPLALLKQSLLYRALLLDLANAVTATLGMVMLLAVNRFLNPSLVMLTPLEIQLQSFVFRVALLVLVRGLDVTLVMFMPLAPQINVKMMVTPRKTSILLVMLMPLTINNFPDTVSGDAHAAGDPEWHVDARQGNLITQSEARHHPAGAALHVFLDDRDALALPEPRGHALADASGADNHLLTRTCLLSARLRCLPLPPPRSSR